MVNKRSFFVPSVEWTYRKAERNESTDLERVDRAFAMTDSDPKVAVVGGVVPRVRKFSVRTEAVTLGGGFSSSNRLSLRLLWFS